MTKQYMVLSEDCMTGFLALLGMNLTEDEVIEFLKGATSKTEITNLNFPEDGHMHCPLQAIANDNIRILEVNGKTISLLVDTKISFDVEDEEGAEEGVEANLSKTILEEFLKKVKQEDETA